MSLWREYFTEEFQKSPERTVPPGRRLRQTEKSRLLRRGESRYEESQNFEELESLQYKKHLCRDHLGALKDREEGVRGVFKSVFHKRSFYRWLLIFCIGFFCAIFGVGIHMLTIFLVTMKNQIVTSYMYSGLWGLAFTFHFVLALLFSFISFCFCYWEPSAMGSGIPETKSYLNGVLLDNFVRLRTLLAKSLSVVFTVSSGLFAGPEGPMVHVGAIIGAALSRWYNRVILHVGTGEWACLDKLRIDSNDTNSRDFVTYGAAAGIAAAFRAPIGGVLFILEEGASFWSTDLTWRTFFCSSVTLLTVIILDRSFNLAGEDMTSNFSFGKFSEASSISSEAGSYAYLIIELSLFILLGCIGGLLGGIFVAVNGFFAKLRKKYIYSYPRRVAEILFLASLTAWMTFTVPLIWSRCSVIPDNNDENGVSFSRDEMYLLHRLVQFDCPQGHYNQVASLFYVDSNTAIKLLFHFREHMSSETFDTGSLLVVLVPYIVLACATCGVALSAGVFVSCLVSGAVMGRLLGHLLHLHFTHQGISDAGTYALVGAAAMIGGVCRNTISLTVMMVEATGNLDYVLPIMLALLSAKYVGDLLSPGLYNNLVKLRELPWLAETIWGSHYHGVGSGGGSSESGKDIMALHLLPISEFMAKPVVCLREAETVGNVVETLQTSTHHLFPVVEINSGQLRGVVSRSSLLDILHAGLFSLPLSQLQASVRPQDAPASEDLSLLTDIDVLCPINVPVTPAAPANGQKPTLSSLRLTSNQCSMYIDLRPYMDPAPHILFESATLKKAYSMFRTLGLRHLIIINRDCKVTGMVTRKDLIESTLLRRCKRQKRRQLHHSMLLRMSLPNAQQLPPLELSVADSHEMLTSGGCNIDGSRSGSALDTSWGGLSDSSTRGLLSDRSDRGLFPSEESASGQQAKLSSNRHSQKRLASKLFGYLFSNSDDNYSSAKRDEEEGAGLSVEMKQISDPWSE